MELQNANPTIVNVSDLPTRRRDQRRDIKHRAGQAITTFESNPRWDASFDEGDGLFGIPSDKNQDQHNNDDDAGDPIDEQEIFDLIATISDPEHPLTLGQLAVVNLPDIQIDPPPTPGKGPDLDTLTTVTVELTPTVEHCSLATVIGLAVRVRLDACLPPNYRINVVLKPGHHDQDDQVTKQLADKERVLAALENDTLKKSLDTMMATCVKLYDSDDEAD